MPEHHDSEKFDVFRRPELELLRHIVVPCRRSVGGVVFLGGGGGGEDDKAKFPNGRPFHVLASREDGERPLGEKQIAALY